MSLQKFHNDFNSRKLGREIDTMGNESVTCQNILCPLSYSTNGKGPLRVTLDLVLQNVLPKIKIEL